jgi:hypothetical protein
MEIKLQAVSRDPMEVRSDLSSDEVEKTEGVPRGWRVVLFDSPY